MERITRLDKVSVFGNKLSFLVPHESVEESASDDIYLYQRPGTESGWLRVSLFTTRALNETPSRLLDRTFRSGDYVSVDEQSGNLVRTKEKDSEEEGVSIHQYYWMVANIVPPDWIYEAVFSYTILGERINEEENKHTVKISAQLAGQAEFCLPR